jgi:hypothetical protein
MNKPHSTHDADMPAGAPVTGPITGETLITAAEQHLLEQARLLEIEHTEHTAPTAPAASPATAGSTADAAVQVEATLLGDLKHHFSRVKMRLLAAWNDNPYFVMTFAILLLSSVAKIFR